MTPPIISRAASFEGGGSPYSSCTYQSIDGLAHNASSGVSCQRLYQCSNCGVESSASSVTSSYVRPHKRCNHGTFVPRPSRKNRRYIHDYYGWVSPPHSPQYQVQQILIPESASASVYGGSIRSDPGGISQSITDDSQENSGNSKQSGDSNYNVSNVNINSAKESFTPNNAKDSSLDQSETTAAAVQVVTSTPCSLLGETKTDDSLSIGTSSEIPFATVVVDKQTKL